MKNILSALIVILLMSGTSKLFAQSVKTETFKVYGNCNMCKKRIEKAAIGEGITKTSWNVDTKVMTVTYDPTKISNEVIQKRIAVAGHDTEKQKAADEVYNTLLGCCKYERKAVSTKQEHANHMHNR